MKDEQSFEENHVVAAVVPNLIFRLLRDKFVNEFEQMLKLARFIHGEPRCAESANSDDHDGSDQ